MATIAPWLKAANPAEEYLRGLALGQQAAEANKRLQAERERTAMEAQVRAETLKQEAAERAQRIATEKAYHDQVIGLQQQRVAAVQQENAQKTRAAAIKLHQQTVYGQVMQQTGDPMQALFKSGLATPERIIAARKDVEDLGSQRLQQRQEALEFREQQAKEKAGKAPVPRRIGERTTTDPLDPNSKVTTYMFEKPPGTAGTAVAGGVKRLRFNAQTGKLEPVGAPAVAAPAETDDESELESRPQ